MEHLEGTLFIDYLSRLKRQRAIDKVKKATKRKIREDVS
jgi:peptide deformylase